MIAFLLGPIGRWLILILLVAASYAAAYVKGRGDGFDKRDAQAMEEAAEARQNLARLAALRSAASEKVVVRYRDRIRVVKESGEEVKKYVEKIDAPDLPGSMRVLHDAATGVVSDPSGGVDAAPVPAQTFAATLAENYQGCRSNEQQLDSLIDWIQSQMEVR